MRSIIRFFVEWPLFANLLSVFVLLAGGMSLFLMKREFFPNVSFEVIIVQTVYPGASALDVEKKITSPLEEKLQELDNVRRFTSISSEGNSILAIELDPDLADEVEAERDVQNIVDRFEDLPVDAQEPIVSALEFRDAPLVEVAVKSQLPDLELRRLARRIERDLEKMKGVARVEPRGLLGEEIRVEVVPEKLLQFRVSISDVVQSLNAQNFSLPGGTVEASGGQSLERIIRTVGDFESLEDVQNAVIRANDLGRAVRVRDIAKVTWGVEKRRMINRVDGEAAISLVVVKSESADAITLVERLNDFIAQNQASYEGAKLSMVDDRSIIIRNRLDVLSNNLLQGIALVIIVLSLFLSLKVSLLVSLSIPLSFLATIALFYITGMSFNVVSLIGLIIVSGLLTDNAVVVVDNFSILRKKGMPPLEAAVEGTRQVWRSITASTLGIVIAFLPMLFMTGIFGKIITAIPVGVIIALLMSLLVSFFVLPAQMAHFVRDPQSDESGRQNAWIQAVSSIAHWWDDVVAVKYRSVLKRIVQARYAVVVAVLIFTFGLLAVLLHSSKKVLFPAEGIEAFYIDTEVKAGVPLATHAKWVEPLEAAVRQLPENELLHFNTTIGVRTEGPGDPDAKRGDQYGRVKVFLTPESERSRVAAEIIDDLRAKIGKPEGFAQLSFGRVRAGPPVGSPISVGIRGENFDRINELARRVKEFIASLPGASDLQDSFNPGKEELQILLKQEEVAAAGLQPQQVARAVLAAYEGIEATSIRRLEEEVEVRVQYPLAYREKLDSINDLLISGPNGSLIPLKNLASWSLQPSLASISHEGFKRQVKITGDIDTNLNDADRVADAIRAKVPEWKKDFPEMEFFFGGEDQDTKESFQALGRAFFVEMIGIFMVLILTFGRFIQPLLILITVPFGALSAMIAFAFHGLPLSFFGMLGVISLAGVIVNNAIVLIDFVNQERESGLDRFESIYEAGSRRLRAIFLSTITNIVGVIPTAYGFGGEDKFVIPIAIALGWGLALGAVLTAVFFPAFLAVSDDLSLFLNKRLRRAR
jgi:multidrug efflux pump subunit AcrB